MVSVSLIFISCGLDSNRPNVLLGYQNVDLLQKFLEAFLELAKESRSFSIVSGDYFDFDNMVDRNPPRHTSRLLDRGRIGSLP